MKTTKPQISIIIVNYNTKVVLRDCLNSLKAIASEIDFEVIVSDNGSTDGSLSMVKHEFPEYKLVENENNLGFGAANNVARKHCSAETILFLNSDTVALPGCLSLPYKYLHNNPEVGALTCKIELRDGSLDKDTTRSFPTPWVAMTHFSYLDRIFPHSRLFARYWYGYMYKDVDKIREIEVLQGAYCLAHKSVLDDIGWFDEDYFLDGEDIDLCWKIKKKGLKIVYYPKAKIIHIKGATKGKRKKEIGKQNFAVRKRAILSGINAMEIFYKKRMWSEYSFAVNYAVLGGIKLLKLVRIVKLYLTE